MNKKLILIIVSVLLLISFAALLAYGLTEVYYYNNPEVEIHISATKNSDIDMVILSYNERSRFGMDPEKEIKIFECANSLRKLYEQVEIGMDEPRYLKAEVSKQPGQATIRLKGYATKDGARKEIDEVIILDVNVTDVVLD